MSETLAKIPENIRQVLSLFCSLNYVLFKCEHILQGANKNVDLLLSDDDYEKVSAILDENGFALYMPENVEKFKKMYVKYELLECKIGGVPAVNAPCCLLTAIHLHREVAWHGVVVLSKKDILERAKDHLPSAEDSLLIHSAHALFENFNVSSVHRSLLKSCKVTSLDYKYIDQQLQDHGWKKAFYSFIESFKISKMVVVSAYFGLLVHKPHFLLPLMVKSIKAAGRMFSLRRKGYLIALVGINGSGKTTLKSSVLYHYEPLTRFVSGQANYYFGWQSSFLSHVRQWLMPKKNIFNSATSEEKEKVVSFSLYQELLLFYIYINGLWRYYRNVYPKLRRNYLVVCDRYFDDLYGQYPYSQRSLILKFLRFPKADALFLLDAPIAVVLQRDKTGKQQRKVQPWERLERQQQRYLQRVHSQRGMILNTELPLEINVCDIISKTWRNFVWKR